ALFAEAGSGAAPFRSASPSSSRPLRASRQACRITSGICVPHDLPPECEAGGIQLILRLPPRRFSECLSRRISGKRNSGIVLWRRLRFDALTMRREIDHSWNLSPREAIALQKLLAGRLVLRDAPRRRVPRLIAGADVSYSRRTNTC